MNYIEYYLSFTENPNPEVIYWIEHNLVNYLSSNAEEQGEIEHIIDYLSSPESPSRLRKMSYEQAKVGAEKWMKAQIKKGSAIKEASEDIEVLKDFNDGYKLVKLVGENAYKREGFLMGHCVASYFGKDDEVLSLRDDKNMPHATLSKESQQIKGKGNGPIAPKYISYVVESLEFLGTEVRDSEMNNLGYVNIEKVEDKEVVWGDSLFREKYFPKDKVSEIKDKAGEEYQSISLWSAFSIFDFDLNLKFKFKFDFAKCVSTFIKTFTPADNSKLAASGNDSQLAASGNDSQLAASGNYSKLAASGNYSQLAASGNDSKLAASGNDSQLAASGNDSQLAASGNYSQLAASGYCSQLAASGYCSQLAASGNYSKLAASGNYSKLAASGDDSKLAASGDYSQLEMSGADSVGANIGVNGKIKGIKGSWITLAEYEDGKVICVKSAMIDGKKLKENTWYKLSDKKFVEIK